VRLAAQAATAIMNGRLFHSLQEKAEELRGLKEYNENILESLDSGIVVLDLEGKVVRWNRAMEGLYGRARAEVLGQAPAPSRRRWLASRRARLGATLGLGVLLGAVLFGAASLAWNTMRAPAASASPSNHQAQR